MTETHLTEPPDSAAENPSHRRRWLLSAVGSAAVMAGVGYAWWRGDEPSGTGPLPGFWDLQWDTPQGGQLQVRAFQGKPLLINFWATWCPPCIEELPLIDAFYRENKLNGWQVLALAVDSLSPVQSFLSKNPLGFTVGLAGSTGTDLSRRLGNLSGGLPFSVVIGARGTVLHRKLGRLTSGDLNQWSGLK